MPATLVRNSAHSLPVWAGQVYASIAFRSRRFMLTTWDRRLAVASNVRPTTAYKPSGKPETLEALEWRMLEKGGKNCG